MSGIIQGLIASLKSAAAATTDAYFNLVTLLLNTTTTNGAQNNTFLDSSSNGYSITRNPATGPNAPTQGTFTPFSQTGWSNYFDGGSSLSVAANAAFTFGTGDFTVEGWIYSTAASSTANGGFQQGTSFPQANTTNTVAFATVNSGQVWQIYAKNTSTNSTATWVTNTWYHFAVVRSGTTTSLYINGTSVITVTGDSTNYTGTYFGVGQIYSSIGFHSGYLSNVRVVKGLAVYTSSFTPPTSPLGATSGGQNPPSGTQTSLLTCQANRFVDNGGLATPNIISVSAGTPSVQAFSPFAPTAAYSTTTVGGSAYLDGNGDYLTVANAAPLQFDAGNFTIQCWVYRAVSGVAHTIASKGSSATGWVFSINASDQLNWTDTSTSNPTTATIPAGAWTHVAAVRSGGNIDLYINGVSRLTFANSTTYNQTSALTVFAGRTQLNSFNGYVSGFEYVKGTALSISIPTAPPTNANSPSLLLNFTNAGIYDAAAKNDLETVGSAQVSGGTYSPTATGTSGASTIVVSSATGLKLGQSVTGTGIGTNAVVTVIAGTIITLSVVNSGTVSGTMTFTEPVKFGTTSMYFDGTGDYLLMPDSPNLQLGTGDFTIDGWVYLAATGVAYGIISKGTASTGWSVNVTSGNKLQFSYTATQLTGATSLSSATWYYFAVVRSGSATGNLKIYLNGTADATSAGAVTDNFNQTNSMYVGADRVGASALNGYIDEIRITKGYARTISTPTAAFPIQ